MNENAVVPGAGKVEVSFAPGDDIDAFRNGTDRIGQAIFQAASNDELQAAVKSFREASAWRSANEIRRACHPCYIINDEEYTQNITRFRAEFESRWNGRVLFGYSVKTNNFPYMLRTALAHGFHAEVVSPDEYAFALRCGCREDNIIYNGPQKRDTVVSACAAGSIVNLDNLEEVERVCAAFRDSEHKKRRRPAREL